MVLHNLTKRLHNSYYPLIILLLVSSVGIGIFNYFFIESRQAEADRRFLEGPPHPPTMNLYAADLELMQEILAGARERIELLHGISIQWQQYVAGEELLPNSALLELHLGPAQEEIIFASVVESTTEEVVEELREPLDESNPHQLSKLSHLYACDLWLFPAVHFDNPLQNLSQNDLLRLLRGEVANWSEYGGWNDQVESGVPADSLHPLAHTLLANDQETREFLTFSDYGLMADKIKTTRGSIALLPAKHLNEQIRHLAVDNIAPLKERGDASQYPFSVSVQIHGRQQTGNTYYDLFVKALNFEASNNTNLTLDYRGCFQDTITLSGVGDMMLSRWVGHKTINLIGDINSPFLDTADYLRQADLTFGNLEAPFDDDGRMITDGMVFKIEPQMIEGLKYAGFDLLDLANNHFGDQRRDGMEFTLDYLPSHGIQHYGAGRTETEARVARIMEVEGYQLGFLGYNDIPPFSYQAGADYAGYALADENSIRTDVPIAKEQSDYLIVSFHWGTEYTPNPTARQRQFAKAAIESGADMIISHHPHVVQAIEWYQEKLIVYSLGNFVFDQMWSEETREGLIIDVALSPEHSENDESVKLAAHSVDLVPVYIEDYHRPRFVDQGHANRILDRVFSARDRL